MKQRESEVFENYAAIAIGQGLVSEAEEDLRRGSDDISTIEALYGVKPNGKNEKDILDQAHPDPVIIAPAYDRINGLVENLKERQNIMVGICRKAPQAKLVSHRYASARKELVDELVRLGFDMDNRNEDELCKLADSCADDMVKKAFLPLVPVAIGLAALVGTIGVLNNFVSIDQGVAANCETAIIQLTEMLDEDEYSSVYPSVNKMILNIRYVKSLGDRARSLQGKLPEASVEGVQDIVGSAKEKEVNKLLNNYQTACSKLAEYAPSYISLLENASKNPSAERDADWIAAVKSVWETISTPEINDAIKSLKTLQKSLLASAKEVDSMREQYSQGVDINKQDMIGDLEAQISAADADSTAAKSPAVPGV